MYIYIPIYEISIDIDVDIDIDVYCFSAMLSKSPTNLELYSHILFTLQPTLFPFCFRAAEDSVGDCT